MVKHPYQESLDCLPFLQGCLGSVFSPRQNVACLKGRDLSCTDAAPGFLIDFTAFAVVDCLFVLWWQGGLEIDCLPLVILFDIIASEGKSMFIMACYILSIDFPGFQFRSYIETVI